MKPVETKTDAPAINTVATDLATQWLELKDIEDAGKRAGVSRKSTGNDLHELLGEGGVVTVNRGGFKNYFLRVIRRSGSVQHGKVIAALVADGHVSQEVVDRYNAMHTGDAVEAYSLQPVRR